MRGSTIISIVKNIKKALSGRKFKSQICRSGFNDISLILTLPLKAEDSDETLTPVEITVSENNYVCFNYSQKVNCISQERGCIAANAINACMSDLPIKCVYEHNTKTFELSSTSKTDFIVAMLNSLLGIVEFTLILKEYLSGDKSFNESGKEFDCIAVCSGYVNNELFEEFNIVDEKE